MGKTIAQKIFEAHLRDNPTPENMVLDLDVVMCHEITTPIAIMDLVEKGMDSVFDPNKIKAVIDHVTPAKDSKTATQGKILRDWAKRHNIKDFFDIGANGVCHALFPEKGFIRPGYTAIMGDSHTCTHGAFGAFAAGVGTTDLEVGIYKGVCSFRKPKTLRIYLTGELRKGVSAKDVILAIIKKITVNGGTDKVIEFVGPVVDAFNMSQRMTLCNMAVEAGATSGICMPDRVTAEYLWPSIKDDYISLEAAVEDFLKWHSDEDAVFEDTIHIDVSTLVPQMTVQFKPDQVVDIESIEDTAVDQVYIGSCTNGRIEDLREAAQILKDRSLAPGVRGIVTPATPHIYSMALDEGLIKIFMDAGFCVLNPTCGACLGMSAGVLAEGEVCASTTNRNFNGRMGKGGMVHLLSPYSAAAAAVTGRITDPRTLLD
ncbi:3-isopropylmalate dehydratase large subunit [Desulfopila inferna]|uniref:3-isopropylmalate dehydratase large subunit n=1 Tax=Desulfopila inferna TaxID=468528 RepID=UPI0019643168|nr:3-isopropylmalate dehydratase large subunit [Desulfopila inferna]MBM9602863.1 3-isopropylmalate dehydratase large subunit [Desulfopila inferna]